jgi:hypothetical protein
MSGAPFGFIDISQQLIYLIVSIAIDYIIKAWAARVDDDSNTLSKAGLDTLIENKDVIKEAARAVK